MSKPARDVARLEALAEDAYTAMYEARPYEVNDCFDDAMQYLGQAIEAAERAGLLDDVAKLSRRREHIRSVYNNQFRGVG